MTLSTHECLTAISRYSEMLAQAAEGHLDVRVEHCPDWNVADLVWHVTDVHWFWATIAEGRLPAPPDQSARPGRPEDEHLIDTFREGAAKLQAVLGNADQDATVWTWASQKDIAFITRHQVQEAAVHAWDAVHAAGRAVALDPTVSADAVDEFLQFSLAGEEDVRDSSLPALGGTFVLRATDTGDSWTVTDGDLPGTIVAERGSEPGSPALEASASDLLLWLYRRVELPLGELPIELAARFHADSFTD